MLHLNFIKTKATRGVWEGGGMFQHNVAEVVDYSFLLFAIEVRSKFMQTRNCSKSK